MVAEPKKAIILDGYVPPLTNFHFESGGEERKEWEREGAAKILLPSHASSDFSPLSREDGAVQGWSKPAERNTLIR